MAGGGIAAMAETATWFYAAGTDSKGPFSFEQMRMLLAAGILRVETLVWTVGMADWVPVRQSPLAQTAQPAGMTIIPKTGIPTVGATAATEAPPAGLMDTALDAIGTCFSKYATFHGRARRAEYWSFVAFGILVATALLLLDLEVLGRDFPILGFLFVLVITLPVVAVLVRRLHDVGRSGWWALLVALPLVGDLALLALCAMRGSQGENRFG